jgi:hypothetical protein
MAKSKTNIVLLTLLLGALGVIACLSLNLNKSKTENLLMAERQQKTLIALIEARMPNKADNTVVVKSGSDDAARKSDPKIVRPDLTEKLAKIQHRYLLRNVWNTYHDGIAALNLPRETQVQLLNLLRARSEAINDAADAARKTGITDLKEISGAADMAANAVNVEITALIGAHGLESLNDTLAIKDQRMQVDRNVGADMAMDGVPLAPNQETALAQLYVDVYKQFPGDTSVLWDTRPIEEVIRQQDQIDAAIIEKAAPILTSEQMTDLKASIDMASQRMRLSVELNKQH